MCVCVCVVRPTCVLNGFVRVFSNGGIVSHLQGHFLLCSFFSPLLCEEVLEREMREGGLPFSLSCWWPLGLCASAAALSPWSLLGRPGTPSAYLHEENSMSLMFTKCSLLEQTIADNTYSLLHPLHHPSSLPLSLSPQCYLPSN